MGQTRRNQNGDVRIGVLPEREEFLVGLHRAGRITGDGEGASEAEMGQGKDHVHPQQAAAGDQFSELDGGGRPVASPRSCRAASITRNIPRIPG